MQKFMALKSLIRRHVLASCVLGVALVSLFGVGIAAHSSSSESASVRDHSASTSSSSATQSSPVKGSANTDVSTAAVAGTSTTSAATTASTPKTVVTPTKSNKPAPLAAPASQQRLIASPTSVSVHAGEKFNGITFRSDDGTPVNMPMFTTRTLQPIFFNFPAGPAKPVWTGDIMSSRENKPGTYTLEIMAQSNKLVEYRTTITITILPTPILTVTIHSIGYEAAEDALTYIVEVDRQYGYSQTINYLTAFVLGQNFECATEPIDENTFALACAHASGPRPASGNIHVNVFTTSEVYSASTAFTLPPL